MTSEELATPLLATKSSRKSGKSKSSSVTSTEYSNASRVKSNALNADDFTRFEEIISFIDHIVGYDKEDEDEDEGHSLPFWNNKPQMNPKHYNIEDIKEIKGALGERSLSVFKKYGEEKINKAVGYITKSLNKLNGRHAHDVKILKNIRTNVGYLLYKTTPKFIKSRE